MILPTFSNLFIYGDNHFLINLFICLFYILATVSLFPLTVPSRQLLFASCTLSSTFIQKNADFPSTKHSISICSKTKNLPLNKSWTGQISKRHRIPKVKKAVKKQPLFPLLGVRQKTKLHHCHMCAGVPKSVPYRIN